MPAATDGSPARRRVALVAGATGGIGGAVARRLARDGFEVFAGGRHRTRLRRLDVEAGVVGVRLDVTSADDVERVRDRVEAAHGRADVVVNAAGVFDLARIVDASADSVDRNFDVNLKGAFNVIRAFLPSMLAAGSGLVISVGSVAGRRAFGGNAAYAASKFALRGLHGVLAEEVRGTGVRSCLVEPGAVDTEIWDPIDPDRDPSLPGRREMLRPEDVARVVGFVAGLPPSVGVPTIRVERA